MPPTGLDSRPDEQSDEEINQQFYDHPDIQQMDQDIDDSGYRPPADSGFTPQEFYDNGISDMANRPYNPDTSANWDNQYNGHFGDLNQASGGALQPENMRQAEEGSDYTPPAAAFGKAEASMGAEAAAETNQFKFDPSGGESRFQHFRRTVLSTKDPRNKRRLAVGGIFGGFTGIILSLLTLILPLKLEATMQNLKQYYFANAESVIAQRAGYLVEQYLLTAAAQVNLTDGCGVINEINKDCFVGTANTPTGALFQEWRQKRFEDKLLTNYGIELRTEPNNRKFLRINGIDAIDYGTASFEDIRLNKDNYKRVVKDAVAYKRVNGALEKETFYKRVYYRYKVGRLLETKFGLNPCVVACNTRKVIKAKKQLAQLTVVNRVVTPRFQFLGLVMGCIIDTSSSSGCNTDPDFGGGDGQPGDRRSALEGELARYAYLSGINVTDEALDKAAGILDDINRRGGFVEYFIGGVAEKIAGEAGEKVALKSIPIVGWVSTAVDLIAQTAKIGTFLRYANYADHAVAAVQMYGTWQSYADELKRGYGDSATNASMAGALSNGIDADAPSSESAEDAPMWAEINGNTSPSTAFNFLIPSVFAEGESEKNGATYTCDDGNTVDNLEGNGRICPEESFQIQNEALGAFARTFDQEPQKTIGDVAREVQTALGLFGNAVDGITSAVIENIPFIESITATLAAQLEPVITALTKSITKYLIPSAINTSMSGARLFQVLAAGANVSATDSNQLTLGAPKVSDQAAARYRQQYLDEVRAEFASKPLSQRLFAKEDTNSLLNRVALASPGSTGNVANSTVATMLSSPFQTISTSFASLFSQPRAFAANPTDPWGIPQAAYDPNDPLLRVDPATYTKEYCAQVTQTWKDSFTLDPVSGQEVATVSNPCLLEEAVAQSLGGYQNPDLLPADPAATPTDNSAPDAAPEGDIGVSPDGFVFPLKTTKTVLTSNTGSSSRWCTKNTTNCHHDYNAADIFAPTGTVVVAARGGTVVKANDFDSSKVGSRVQIRGDDGLLYYYAHMGEGTIKVKNGDKITAGQQLGNVGTKADAVGTDMHLHFDILPSSYSLRVSCSGAACSKYPFIAVQPSLTAAFAGLPQ